MDPKKPKAIVPYIEAVEAWVENNPSADKFVVCARIGGASVAFEITAQMHEYSSALERVTAELVDPSIKGEVFFPTCVTFWENGNIKDIDFVPTFHHPIEISFYESGLPSNVEYRTLMPDAKSYDYETYHNDFGPAIVSFNERGMITFAAWYLQGKQYHCNGPSEVKLDADVGVYHFTGFSGSRSEGPSEAVFDEFQTPNSISLLKEPAFYGLHSSLVDLA